MAVYFLSDVHLCAEAAVRTRAFVRTLRVLAEKRPEAVFILGDLFDAWIGDKAADAFAQEMAAEIRALAAVCPVFLQRGNRDFLLGKNFCALSGMALLPDVFVFEADGAQIRVEHGDLLCTDDVGYQRLRKLLRSRLLYCIADAAPRWFASAAARWLRGQSKKRTAAKPSVITDVNADAVRHAVRGCDVLIHGHTHRPALHTLAGGARRFVLGDWHPEAKILCMEGGKFSMLDSSKL